MPEVPQIDNDQIIFLSLNSRVDPDSTARLIGAFVDSLDLASFGIKETAIEGRPRYSPASMLKLYIYGSREGIFSSRKLEKSCRINLEVMWLMGGTEPDFRTIAKFRRDNIDSMKKIFHEFNRRISGAVQWGFSSIDGSKFLASNSKDRNFTQDKLDDRIKMLDKRIEEYLQQFDNEEESDAETTEDTEMSSSDTDESPAEPDLAEKLANAQARLEQYKSYQQRMEENGLTQISLTDPDAKLMKSHNGFVVAYNPQTVVDSETQLIRDFNMTSKVNDNGLLLQTMSGIREESEGILELVADRGYENEEDMAAALENGIIPHVITDKGQDGYLLEVPYEAGECDPFSDDPKELRKCLRAGQIPDAYSAVISEMEILEKPKISFGDNSNASASSGCSQEEMKARARMGFFVRDLVRNLVYCPAGQILRFKGRVVNNGGYAYDRYYNKKACTECVYRGKCFHTKVEFKVVLFNGDKTEKPCRDWLISEGRADEAKEKQIHHERETMQVVQFRFRPDRQKTLHRKELSEHPFGTIKRAMGATHFHLRGLVNVAGEFALFCLGYNLARAKNLLGFQRLMELLATP